MGHRVVIFIAFLAVTLCACNAQLAPLRHHPAASQSGGNPMAGAAVGGGAGSTGSNAACSDIAGTWLMARNDCAGNELVIAQDGCNVAVQWGSPLAGTISGSELTVDAVNDSSFVCTAAVDGKSLSGSCVTDTDVDGYPSVCTFEAIFSGK